MDCSTRFPDPVELVRSQIEALGLGLVLRCERGRAGGTWVAELERDGEPFARAAGATPHDAAQAALGAARRTTGHG